MHIRSSLFVIPLLAAVVAASAFAADVDVVVKAPKPLVVKIGSGAATVEKKVTIVVANAASDAAGATVRLIVSDGDCPAGTVGGAPDFGKKSTGAPDTTTLLPGKNAKATVRVQVSAAAFTAVGPKVPTRCALAITAVPTAPGAVDPTPANAEAPLPLDVLDANDAAAAPLAEVMLAVAKPILVTTAPGKPATKTVKLTASNPSSGGGAGTPDAELSVVTITGACPPGVTAGADFAKTPGVQSSVRVRAGKKASGTVALTFDASAFPPGTKASPARCVLTLGAVSAANTDGTNDVVLVVLDVSGGSGAPRAASQAPTASFTVGTTGAILAPVTFDASASTDPDGDPLTYAWSFGDGGNGGGAALAHAFATAGSFTVRLTVSDGRGGTDTSEQNVTIGAGATAQGTVPAAGVVRNLAGTGLAGVGVAAEGGGTGTTDAQGKVTVNVPRGVPFKLVFTKSGYTTQYLPFSVPAGAEGAIFETSMVPQEAPQMMNATLGGTAAGKDGATLILPPGGLVGAGGAPVSGLVAVAITPVDPASDPQSFPGRYAGFNAAGEEGLLLSHGTVEYVLAKNGAPVQLAPGTTATIEIPIYATLDKTGAPIAVGAVIPLWSLDERTGGWIQEGTGVVVAAPGSPSGLALRATVGHLSWWNCDAFERPSYRPKPKCMVDSNADGVLEDLTGTGHCWNAGTGPEQPPNILNPIRLPGTAANAVVPRYPAYAAQTTIPAAGGVVLPVPANLDITIHASAKNGTLVGSKVINGGPDVEEEVQIELTPISIDDALPITLPWDQTYTLATGAADQYRFEAEAGDEIYLIVSRSNAGTGLTGSVLVETPDDDEIGPVTFGNASGKLGFLAPADGVYHLVIAGTAGTPAGYRLQASNSGTIPIVVATTPANDASGVAVGTAVSASFTNALNASTVTAAGLNATFTLTGPLGTVAGTASATGATATFTPTAALDSGVAYTARLTTGITSSAGDALSLAYEWSFTTGGDGATAPLSRGNSPDLAFTPTGDALVIYESIASDGRNPTKVSRFVPGEGWKAPVTLPVAQASSSTPDIVTSSDGSAIAVWKANINAGGPSVAGIFASRYTPDDGWSAAETLEPATNNTLGALPQVVIDDTGRAIAVWRYGNELRWRRYLPASGWSATATLFAAGAQPSFESGHVAMNGAGNAVAIRFANQDVLVRRFDPASGWTAAENLGNDNLLRSARVGIDPTGNALAVWKENPAWRWRRFDAATTTWEAEQTLFTDGTGAFDPVLIMFPTGHALFAGRQSIPTRVWQSRYDPTTKTWTAPDTLIDATTCVYDVASATNESVAYTAWIDCTTQPTTLHWRKYTTAGGWGDVEDVVTANLRGATHPASMRLGIAPDDTGLIVYERHHLIDDAVLATRIE